MFAAPSNQNNTSPHFVNVLPLLHFTLEEKEAASCVHGRRLLLLFWGFYIHTVSIWQGKISGVSQEQSMIFFAALLARSFTSTTVLVHCSYLCMHGSMQQ
jgi:hypothetical protein